MTNKVMAIEDDEKRRDDLETLLREHVSDANQDAINTALMTGSRIRSYWPTSTPAIPRST